jgi:hypothetical protein
MTQRRIRWLFVLGALGGLALGTWLARRWSGGAHAVRQLRRPARAARPEAAPEGPEEAALRALEDRVLDAFLADPILSERGIDIGALGPGIIELTGSVATADEAAHAVRVAETVEGVHTVVNRLIVEAEEQHVRRVQRRRAEGDPALTEHHWYGQGVGTGARRQGDTEPERPDEALHLREVAWEKSHDELHEWADEDVVDEVLRHAPHPSPGGASPSPSNPGGENRLGPGLEPGVELELEHSDLPYKPHQRPSNHAE